MAHYWILFFSWFNVASPQYINTAGPGAESLLDPLDAKIHYPPLPYVNYLNFPFTRNDYETGQNGEQPDHSAFFVPDIGQIEAQRKRRTAEEIVNNVEEKLASLNLIDKEKSNHRYDDKRDGQFIIGLASSTDDNSTELLNAVEKRSFSPWGGKRSDIEHMWSWKRSQKMREPSMPKRVRFSPWGGKRSGQMVYKPETKNSKLIFSAHVPELTRIISNYPHGKRWNLAGIHFTPTDEKRIPIKVLPMDSIMGERNSNDVSFKAFLESLPKFFKPGQTYANVYLKKDGKSKFKFSAWGGKRSPPIIGPIWSPTTQNMKQAALDTIILIRKNQGSALKTT